MNTHSFDPLRLYLEQLQALGMDSVYVSNEALQALISRNKSADQETIRKPSAPLNTNNKAQLDALAHSLKDCARCRLCEKRTQVVFGVGNPEAELVFVGEGPGADEDAQGIPFVGKAGQLLTKMIENGMGIKRDSVYICNVVKCRPPGNRNPELDEMAVCEPFLIQQLEIIQPKVIVALGKFAAQSLLRTQTPITRLRGNWGVYNGIKVMPTFHPAYLLRNEAGKKDAWEDLKKVMSELGISLPKK